MWYFWKITVVSTANSEFFLDKGQAFAYEQLSNQIFKKDFYKLLRVISIACKEFGRWD